MSNVFSLPNASDRALKKLHEQKIEVRQALLDDNEVLLEQLINAGYPIETRIAFSDSPALKAEQGSALNVACHLGSPQCVKVLLQAGADIETLSSSYQHTPFIYAVSPSYACRTPALLVGKTAEEAYLEAKSERVRLSPLKLRCMLLLADYGADIEELSPQGLSPFMIACGWSTPLAKSLHLLGADPSMVTSYGDSALQHILMSLQARYTDEIAANDRIRWLLSLELPELINKPDSKGFTPLTWAAHLGNAPLVDLLLFYGAQIAPVHGRPSPLGEACLHGGLEVVDALLKAKAPLESLNYDGETPLLQAARSMHEEVAPIIERLLLAGANLLAQDLDGMGVAERFSKHGVHTDEQAAFSTYLYEQEALAQGSNLSNVTFLVRKTP